MSEEIKYYFHSKTHGFYSSEFPGTIGSSGLTISDLTEISAEDYMAFFNPPEGKISVWVEDMPMQIMIPGPDYQAEARAKRDALIAEANALTYPFSLRMLMGRTLTDAEKDWVHAWMNYTDKLDDLDMSQAPDITWPVKPG